MNNKELFLYKKPIKINNDFKMWMAFPGPYSFSMSSLGYLWLFKTLDCLNDINVERITSDTKKTLYGNNEIDLIAFSFTFDTDFLTIFSMLDKYKIPLRASQRGENYPLIAAGGPVVTANPMPYNEFFDFFVIGDGEDTNVKAANICKQNKGRSKQEILSELSKLEGIYVPSIHGNKVKKVTKKLTECIYTPIICEKSFFKDTFIIEIARGCMNRCGFCLASYLNLPLRCIPYKEIISAIDTGLAHTDKIALLGAQISAHPHFEDICKYVNDKIAAGNKIEMSFSSLRVDAIKPNIVKTLVLAGQKHSTLAIEAGSERLRKTINKNITEEQIIAAVKTAKDNGLKGLKLYGMIGIPTETQDDIGEIINLSKKIKHELKNFNISFGFSTFVPKPHTPFQWCGRDNTNSLEVKSNYLKKELHKLGISSQFSSLKWDYWQAVLSRGDEKLNDFVEEVYKSGGKLGSFKAAARKLGINTDFYATTNYDFTQKLPWDFIEINPGKEFLIKENIRLLHPTKSEL